MALAANTKCVVDRALHRIEFERPFGRIFFPQSSCGSLDAYLKIASPRARFAAGCAFVNH
jgi:hypothetical protein